MKKQAGFTIIELVVVIALLGILAAVALPRFVNVTEDAHNAAVQGVAGGLASGVALVKAKAIVQNTAPTGDNIRLDNQDASVAVNAFGFPVGASGATSMTVVTAEECIDVWNNVLSDNSPTVSTGQGAGVDYAATAATTFCTFTYRQQNNETGTPVNRTVVYDSETGRVTTTNAGE